MKNHTKFAYAQDVFNDLGSSFSVGFNFCVNGHTYNECFKYPHDCSDGARQNGWQTAEKFIKEGKVYYRHNFHQSHGGCEGCAFPYGGYWVCNTCRNSGVDRPWWFIKVFADGNAWICVGEDFADLQASDNYAFGATRKEAITNYGDLMAGGDAAIQSGEKGGAA